MRLFEKFLPPHDFLNLQQSPSPKNGTETSSVARHVAGCFFSGETKTKIQMGWFFFHSIRGEEAKTRQTPVSFFKPSVPWERQSHRYNPSIFLKTNMDTEHDGLEKVTKLLTKVIILVFMLDFWALICCFLQSVYCPHIPTMSKIAKRRVGFVMDLQLHIIKTWRITYFLMSNRILGSPNFGKHKNFESYGCRTENRNSESFSIPSKIGMTSFSCSSSHGFLPCHPCHLDFFSFLGFRGWLWFARMLHLQQPTTTETPAAEVKTEEPAVYLEWLNFGVEAS